MGNNNIDPQSWHALFLMVGFGVLAFLFFAGFALVIWAGN